VYVCAVAVVSVAVPVFATGQAEGKNDCLVYGKNCPNTVDSLPERIIKLKTEIAKGKNVYTDDEFETARTQIERG